MQAVVASGTGTQAQLPGGRPAAGKTGTTDEHGDAWFIGFTPQLTTAVWMGSPESVIPMQNVGGINVFGGTFPALVWHNFMEQAMDGLPVVGFTPPGPTPPSMFLQMPFENLRGSTRPGGTRSTPTRPAPPRPTPTPAPAPPASPAPPSTPAPAPAGNGNGRGNGNGNGYG